MPASHCCSGHENLPRRHRPIRSWIERYFDVRAKPTQEALATLSQVVGTELKLEVPTLDDTLTALRNFKLGRDNSGQGR